MSARAMCLAAWHNSRRQSDVGGAVTLTAPAFAGYTLETAGGDVDLARQFVPTELEVFWARVRDALDQIATEEDTRPLAVGERS